MLRWPNPPSPPANRNSRRESPNDTDIRKLKKSNPSHPLEYFQGILTILKPIPLVVQLPARFMYIPRCLCPMPLLTAARPIDSHCGSPRRQIVPSPAYSCTYAVTLHTTTSAMSPWERRRCSQGTQTQSRQISCKCLTLVGMARRAIAGHGQAPCRGMCLAGENGRG